MEMYMDNMLVKSCIMLDHINDLKKAFATLHQYWMKLNQAIWTFKVTLESLLGS